jgi:nucleotide-binding universal stress UspA family protein
MTIVVGYVPSQTGLLAIDEAAREAQVRNAPVIVVNALGATAFEAPTAADEQDLDAVAARLTRNHVANSLRQVDVETSPADAILHVAQLTNASLIVLGMHRRSPLAKRALGSTVRSVALRAPCPVLVVPDVDEHPKHWSPDRPLPLLRQD